MSVQITSFGYGHGEPPAAHLTVDVRQHLRDPHIAPGLRYLTARDQPVLEAVLRTPGAAALISALAAGVRALLAGPTAGDVHVAVGCVGGRHRSAVIADRLHGTLVAAGVQAVVVHRDLDRPVITR